MTVTELRLVCDFYYALFGARKIPFHDSYRLLTLITRVIKCRIDRRRCLRIILLSYYSVIGERCLIKESLFHPDLSSSWLPDNKMILSKDRYGYFFRKRRTKKTDVRDKNHKIVSLFVWTESIFEVRLLSSKWLAKIWKRKGGKLVENFVALARSFVLSIPPNTFFFSQVDFFNSIIRDN